MVSEMLPGREFAYQSVWQDGQLVAGQARERVEYLYGHLTPSGQTSTPVGRANGRRARGRRRRDPRDPRARPRPCGAYCVDIKESASGIPNVTEINAGRFFTTSNFFAAAGLNMPDMLDTVRARRTAPERRQLPARARPLLDPHGRHGLHVGARRRARPLSPVRPRPREQRPRRRGHRRLRRHARAARRSRGRRSARASRSAASRSSGTTPTCDAGRPVTRAEVDAAKAAPPVPFVMEALDSVPVLAVLTNNDESAVETFLDRWPELRARVRAVVGRRALGGPKTDFDGLLGGLRELPPSPRGRRARRSPTSAT